MKKLDPEDVMKEIELEPRSLQRDIDVLIAVAKAASIEFDKETSLEAQTAVKNHVAHDHDDLPVVNSVDNAASVKVDKETSMKPGTAVKDHDHDDDLPVDASWKDVTDRLKKKSGSGGRLDRKVVDRLQALNISSMPGKNTEEKVPDKFSKLVIFEGLSREESLRRERLLKKPVEEEAEREHDKRMKRDSKRSSRFENFRVIDPSLKKRRDFGRSFDHMKIVDHFQALDITMPRKKMEEKVSGEFKFEALSKEELLRRERPLKKRMIFQEEEERENHIRMKRDCKRPLMIENFEEKEKKVGMEKVDTKKNTIAKKAKLQPEVPNPPPNIPIPIEVMNRVEEMGGTEVKLVIQKTLQRTDCSSKHNRLSIPLNSVISKDFLDKSEMGFLEGISEDGTRNSIQVVLIQPDNLETVDILLRKWSMRKENGRASHMYVLNKPWIDVVLGNQLEANDLIQLWSFRVDGNLCLALVRLPEINRN